MESENLQSFHNNFPHRLKRIQIGVILYHMVCFKKKMYQLYLLLRLLLITKKITFAKKAHGKIEKLSISSLL